MIQILMQMSDVPLHQHSYKWLDLSIQTLYADLKNIPTLLCIV